MIISVQQHIYFGKSSKCFFCEFKKYELSPGNFIANLKQSLGNDVIRMNYLGDWGMQFGEFVVQLLSR